MNVYYLHFLIITEDSSNQIPPNFGAMLNKTCLLLFTLPVLVFVYSRSNSKTCFSLKEEHTTRYHDHVKMLRFASPQSALNRGHRRSSWQHLQRNAKVIVQPRVKITTT
uniref:(northern house mosquito) hypothetical protein n=1 Tax=Culex pipiens TaxID=7175 RepID=A0A8D8CNL3_CULPI